MKRRRVTIDLDQEVAALLEACAAEGHVSEGEEEAAIRVVADANVLISAAPARSPTAPSALVLDAALDGRIELVSRRRCLPRSRRCSLVQPEQTRNCSEPTQDGRDHRCHAPLYRQLPHWHRYLSFRKTETSQLDVQLDVLY